MGDVNFTISFDSNGDVVLKNVKSAVDDTTGAFDRAAPAIKDSGDGIDILHKKGLGAHQALGMLAGTVGQMGEAGHIAAGGLIAAATGVGIIGIAVAVASTGVALLVEHFKSAADAEEKLNDAFRVGDLGFFDQQIAAVDKKLVDVETQIDTLRRAAAGEGFINQLSDFLGGAPSASTVLPDAIKRQSEAQLEKDKLVAAQQKILAKNFGETTLQLQFQTAAVGQNAIEMEYLSNDLRLVQALQHGLAKASQETKDEFIAANDALTHARIEDFNNKTQFTINSMVTEAAAVGQAGRTLDALNLSTKIAGINQQYMGYDLAGVRTEMIGAAMAAFQLKTAYDQIAAGKAGISQFQQQFGVQFQIDKDLSGLNIAKTFMTGFNAFKDDLKEWPNLVAAFNSAVPQLIQSGVQDPQEMLMSRFGLSSANLERLKNTLPAEVKSAFDATIVVGDQWGKSFDDRFKKFTESAAEAAKSVQPIQDELEKLTNSAAKNLALKVDVAEALQNVQNLRTAIDLIPDITHKELIYDVYYAMSPKAPFSQLLPAMASKFSSLADLVNNATPDIVMNVPNFNQQLAQIQALQQQLYQAQWDYQVAPIGGYATMTPIPYLEAQIAALKNSIAGASGSLLAQANDAAARPSSSSGGGSSGGGGAGGAVVNIDLRGSSMSRNFLDDELIPALERGIIRATGQSPSFQVLN